MGIGELAGWLHTAVIKVVTTYTAPGGRVLLVASAVTRTQAGRCGGYRGLHEAAWSVARVGRSVQVAYGSDDGLAESDSGPVGGVFDVVIAAAEPTSLLRMRPTGWSSRLSSGGLLAVITHGARVGAEWCDPAGRLVRAGREDGLRYLDHVVLLQEPVEAESVLVQGPVGRSVRTHADLHVFGRAGVPELSVGRG